MGESNSSGGPTAPAGPGTVLVEPSPSPPNAAERIWELASAALRNDLPPGNFSAWFSSTTAVGLDDHTFVLGAPNPFVKEWIETRYADALRVAVSNAAGAPLDVAILAYEVPDVADEHSPEAHLPDVVETPSTAVDPDDAVLHPKYTFDSFVIGASNRFAHAAAQAVAEAPAKAYNPLFIYGGAGLGKTHLLHGIARYVRDCHPGSVVRYVSSEQFMNDFIGSLQRRTIPEFHRRYRAADLLLVDDIQFLEGKE
ncbi:MAG TPA: DnaA/Hda family protein, partial [Actinomycetota bacterium]